MNIFNFLMRNLHDKVTDKSNFGLILLAIFIVMPMQYFMPKRSAKYFKDKSDRIQALIGQPKYRVNMDVNVLTKSMVDETFVIENIYLDNVAEMYVYNLKDKKDGTVYENVPESFLCPLRPKAFATNNVSFQSLMETLTEEKKERHDVSW
jgi:hypothetical protein